MKPVLDVYVAAIGDAVCPVEAIRSESRRAELLLPQCESLRRSRLADWHLLETGLERLGLDPAAIRFEKSASGRWHCGEICFSLSHSDRYVACAVSDRPVGVDLEEPERFEARFAAEQKKQRLKERIALPAERDMELLPLWLAKESVFKASPAEVFKPSAIDTSACPVRLADLRPALPLMLCVCGERLPQMRLRVCAAAEAKAQEL